MKKIFNVNNHNQDMWWITYQKMSGSHKRKSNFKLHFLEICRCQTAAQRRTSVWGERWGDSFWRKIVDIATSPSSQRDYMMSECHIYRPLAPPISPPLPLVLSRCTSATCCWLAGIELWCSVQSTWSVSHLQQISISSSRITHPTFKLTASWAYNRIITIIDTIYIDIRGENWKN